MLQGIAQSVKAIPGRGGQVETALPLI
jgi:hypothetical protein